MAKKKNNQRSSINIQEVKRKKGTKFYASVVTSGSGKNKTRVSKTFDTYALAKEWIIKTKGDVIK